MIEKVTSNANIQSMLATLRAHLDIAEGWLVETGPAVGAHAGADCSSSPRRGAVGGHRHHGAREPARAARSATARSMPYGPHA
jgi:hypothetical protein